MKKPSAISRIAAKFSDPRNVSKAVETQKSRNRTQATYEAPATAIEEGVAAIWSKLLVIDRVGRNDHFFLMGGHSLLATQMMARVRDAFNVELPLKALFEAPLLSSFAGKVELARSAGVAIERPTPQPRGNTAPLSFAQQRLWFLDQLAPGSPFYNIPQRYRLYGKLNRDAMQQALDAVVRRQESLRTTFADSGSGPVQVIASHLRIPLQEFDLTHLEASQREAEALRLVQQEAGESFDLATGPLMRVLAIRMADEEYELVINTHHIVYDRWSQGILMDELTAHYRTACAGTEETLPPLPVQYADFSIWQRRYLEGEVLTRQIAYWKDRLAGAPSLVEFPTDYPRTAAEQHHGNIEDTVLTAELVSRIRQFCQDEGATLFMGMLAAFQVLLSRYSGLEDIVVGSPIANRNLTEIEPLIGFFVNTLALRSDLSGNPTFGQLLARVRETCLGAYANEAVPFERLVEELQPERSLSHNPVFQVVFALQPAPVPTIELPELRMERRPLHAKTALFDVSWAAFERPDGSVLLRAEYNTDLFCHSTIRRLLAQFERLLEGILATPATGIADLPVLTADDERLLTEWNHTSAEYPRDACAHQLFETQAALHPDNLAVACGDSRLTYRELNERANQLAHHLRAAGVGRESLVGLCLNRSIENVVAIAAVVKAGGAYLPIDPAYPKERIEFMLDDAQVKVLITSADLTSELPAVDAAVFRIDTDWPSVAGLPTENVSLESKPGNMAYVIYTSGSTGRPKGVEIEHRGLVNLMSWHCREYDVQPHDRATQIAAPAFDASVWEIWPYLGAGASIHIPYEETRRSPERILRWLESERITLSFLPTPLAEAVLDELERASTKLHLRALLTGGDKLHQRPDASLSFRLVNHYGPTESTVVTTAVAVSPEGEGAPPIGKPIANIQTYILDANLRPVPIGVAGELYVGGDALARGYLRRPELTEERFVRNPFGDGRLYRTGDRVRYLADGNIEFLGRLDQQVKIRGFRIELGEIEAVLGQHPAVKECAVVARERSGGGEPMLAAYIVARETQPAPGELQTLLKAQLPDYMVPAAFAFLPALPITPNGKIDVRALPAPEVLQEETTSYVEPATPVEEMLCGVWADVLRRPRVGVQDNFFAIGGHSLLATQVISRIRAAVGVEAPLRTLFESPTIRELAGRIEQMKQNLEFIPIRRVPRDGPMPLSFAQQRLWFLDQLDPDSSSYSAPWIIRMRGMLRPDALEHALNEIVRRHEVFRTTFTAIDGRPFQVIAPEVRIDLPMTDIGDIPAAMQESEVRRLMSEKVREPFNLQVGPMFRASLVRLSDQDHVLLLNSHHIANDGWSMWQFIKDLGEFYAAHCEGRPASLPELPVQYADFAAWQRQWLDGEILERQLAFWREKLEGAPDTLELPTDFPRPAALSYRGSTEKVTFPRTLSDRLNEFTRSEGATLYMTLLAAYQTLLFRYTGQEDIVVGSPIANRTRAGIEGLLGFFVNTMVMRTDLSGNPTFRELLRRVREFSLGAYTHQDLPFEKLVEVLRPDRYLGRVPLFQVWFALQNAPRTDARLPGIELSSMDVHTGTSKFDLGLFIAEKPEGLVCTVEYSTDLFEAATIRRMLGHFLELLEGIAGDPDRHVAELPLLGREERRQVLTEWNDTYREFPRERSLHQFIEDQVQRTPDAPALMFESQRLTYSELNARANQLAHHLRKRGVGPEVFVAICAERSVEMVVGLLGIMKAGGAYVPVDPDYPKDRLVVMLEDSAPPVVLTLERLLEVLPPHDIPTICLDRDWDVIAAESTENPAAITNGKDQAYMIYTSGSTGKPKGVPNVHEGIVNRLLWMQDAYHLDGTDRVLQKTPYSFDVSVWEFFWPLMTGASLVVARPEGHKDPAYLVDLIVEQKITTMHFVPSMLRIFLEAEGVERCTSLRRVVCSGEALPADLVERFFERLGRNNPAPELHNLYGPTEAAVDVSYWQCRPESGRTSVPIGKPIWNTQLYVLDERLQPLPVGIPGELHIGGVGLARGYLKRPELTAEKFIRNPFANEPGARLYKTGDLARLLPDGNIEYLGRLDHQVKIRGFRIELGEIESVLDSHPGVRQSVVMAREDQPGDKRLVAYLIADPNYSGSDQAGTEDTLSDEQVSQWALTFDEAYRQGGDARDATFNITGWDSSYTGKPIPAEEMRVWVESTSERIVALRPKHLWEIGCGTGLLTFRVAPHCERYHGSDVSQTALTFLGQQLRRPELALPGVTLERKPAHEFDTAGGQFDTVVMNSVIQYFPSLDYFLQVVKGAVETVGREGSVFIGDVRSFPMLETFQASVQMFQADDSASRTQVWQRAQKNLAQEGELLLAPALFHALRQQMPQISRVEIQLKRGRAHNELTRYRYDVVLHVGPSTQPRVHCPWLDWKKHGFSLDLLRETLQKTGPDILGLTGIPNARLQYDVAARQLLSSEDSPAGIREIRGVLQTMLAAETAAEPEDFWEIEREFPYRVEIRPSSAEVDGCFDVLLRKTTADESLQAVVRFPGEPEAFQPLSTYASNPMRQKVAGKLVPQLRTWVSAKLPEYMMPSAFVLLDAVPLSANGKINRRALPAPEQSRSEEQGSYVAPRTPAEEVVAAILADVLRLDRVGVEDDFFQLGGHSLSATQVIARARQAFQVELSVRALFEAPTAAALAAWIERLRRGSDGLAAPPLVRQPRNGPLPLSFAQQRLWFLDQLEPNNPLYSMPRATRMTGAVDVSAMEKALQLIVERHEVLRTIYGVSGDDPVQIVLPEISIPLPLIDLTSFPNSARETEARRILEEESQKPFELARGPIIRALMLRLDAEDHIFFINMHHIANDGWSMSILIRELAAVYESVIENKPAALSELPIQYADYAIWQRNWLQGEILEKQLAYWRTQLDGAPPVLALPSDRPRPLVQTFRGEMQKTYLPANLAKEIQGLSRRQGTTTFMTMLAAFQSLLLYRTGQPDIVLGADVAGRTNVQTESLIGFFVNLLVLRTNLSGDPTFQELLGRVRETALGAYAHQDVPFDKLVAELQPERTLSHNPLVQVLFVQLDVLGNAFKMRGIEFAPFRLSVSSKFDLAVFVGESGDGVVCNWVYNSDLFDAASITRMAELFQAVLEKTALHPEMHLSEVMQKLAENEEQQRAADQQGFQAASLRKLKSIKRKPSTETV